MIVVCPNCFTRYKLTEEHTPASQFQARCGRCGQIFTAYSPVQVEPIQFVDLEQARKARADNTVIAVSNQKGGVAKTTTCLNLGLSLALHSKRVLLVDFDVQANLTISLGLTPAKSIYDLIAGKADDMDSLIRATKYEGLSLLPSSKNLVLLNKRFFGAPNFEFILKDRLAGLKEKFDYILIDTPPSIELFTLNALTAAGMTIIPTQCDYLSTHGIEQILKLIELVRSKTNPALEARVLITMFDPQSTASRLISKKINRLYGDITFQTLIEMDHRIKEAQIMSMPVIHYNKHSKAGRQYLKLAKEIIH